MGINIRTNHQQHFHSLPKTIFVYQWESLFSKILKWQTKTLLPLCIVSDPTSIPVTVKNTNPKLPKKKIMSSIISMSIGMLHLNRFILYNSRCITLYKRHWAPLECNFLPFWSLALASLRHHLSTQIRKEKAYAWSNRAGPLNVTSLRLSVSLMLCQWFTSSLSPHQMPFLLLSLFS